MQREGHTRNEAELTSDHRFDPEVFVSAAIAPDVVETTGHWPKTRPATVPSPARRIMRTSLVFLSFSFAVVAGCSASSSDGDPTTKDSDFTSRLSRASLAIVSTSAFVRAILRAFQFSSRLVACCAAKLDIGVTLAQAAAPHRARAKRSGGEEVALVGQSNGTSVHFDFWVLESPERDSSG